MLLSLVFLKKINKMADLSFDGRRLFYELSNFRSLLVAEVFDFGTRKTHLNHFYLKTPKKYPINLNKLICSLKMEKKLIKNKKNPKIQKISKP